MISLEKDGGYWIAVIDRPDKANSLTPEMLERLCEIAEAAREAQVLVLTGVGKVFSAGADLEAARAGLATSPLWERLSGAIARLPGLTICALNGTLAGGAMGMALACDLRIAVQGAKFFYPVMKLGFLPQPSDPVRLAALVGLSRVSSRSRSRPCSSCAPTSRTRSPACARRTRAAAAAAATGWAATPRAR